MQTVISGIPNKGELLIVDDTAASLSYLSELLTREGYRVRAAPSGELALWTVATRAPDLILMDVRMPDINGFEVCRRLKQKAETRQVPVIFLSAQNDTEDKVQGFQAGGVDYIEKPFSSEEVLQRVATHVQLAQVSRALDAEKQRLEQRVQERTRELECAAEQLRAEVQARSACEANSRLAACAFNASLSGMLITDTTGQIVAVNPAFSQLMGYSAQDCLGQHPRLFDSGRHDPALPQAVYLSLLGTGQWAGEVWPRRKDGNTFPCLLTISAARDEGGEMTHFVAVLLDLSETRDAQTLIEFLTRHDPLTGLPNRVLVRDRAAQLMASVQGSGETLSVICIDIDKFRLINEFHGRQAGDELLQWAARQISECVPATDTVFRESGDEFMVLHCDPAGELGVRLLVESLIARLKGCVRLNEQAVTVSGSAGVAVYPADGQTLEELIGNAAITKSRAKTQGGGAYAFFSETLDQGVRTRFDIAQRLRHALAQEEFEVYYQPQVKAASGLFCSAEALLRWRTADKGFISPAQFIPVAEETGDIVAIGTWVLQTVCGQIARWHAEGHGWIKVAVNLSAQQFMRQDLCTVIRQILEQHQIPATSLELEITESLIVEDVQQAISTMHALKAIGLTLSLDDFGTGYSSLSYLKQFPMDYLKIDQSFVRDLCTESSAEPIVLSIIGLAHNMQMQVIAEGVELPAQQAFLSANGCDILQGYLFSKPVCAQDFIAHVQTAHTRCVDENSAQFG